MGSITTLDKIKVPEKLTREFVNQLRAMLMELARELTTEFEQRYGVPTTSYIPLATQRYFDEADFGDDAMTIGESPLVHVQQEEQQAQIQLLLIELLGMMGYQFPTYADLVHDDQDQGILKRLKSLVKGEVNQDDAISPSELLDIVTKWVNQIISIWNSNLSVEEAIKAIQTNTLHSDFAILFAFNNTVMTRNEAGDYIFTEPGHAMQIAQQVFRLAAQTYSEQRYLTGEQVCGLLRSVVRSG